MSKTILRAKLFGSFSLQYKDQEIILDRGMATKTVQLLQLLLLHARDGISKNALMDALYGSDGVENRNASLNNTIFRLRRQLKASGLPESSYILLHSGMCRWDPEIPVCIDTCEFENLIARARGREAVEERMALYDEARQVYTAEFLPNMIGEDWAAVENVRLRTLYFDMMKEFCGWLKEQERFEDLRRAAHAAAEIYPFDEWQLWEIDSLIGMACYSEGMEVYERTAKLMFDELGLPPSPEMLKRFRIMGERVSQASGAISDIKSRLQEKEKAPGAYYCTFPSFVDTYHIFGRMMGRTGLSVYIMLCTLKEKKSRTDAEEKKVSAVMQKAIQRSLRQGDFYTRYNARQYLIMLLGISQEDCRIVSNRIDKAFTQERDGFSDCRIDYFVASIADVRPEKVGGSLQFRSRNAIWKNP